MTKITKLFLVAFTLLCATSANAQGLTDEEKEVLKDRVVQKVEEFQYLLGKIVDTRNSRYVRTDAVNLIYNLFIGQCEPYDYYDYELDENVHSKGVRMQTSSTKRVQIGSQLMKNYITKLYNPATGRSKMSYTKIEIDSVGAVRVDNIEQVGDHYECVAYFCQKFIGYRDGRAIYSDVTTKKVKFYIKQLDGGKFGRRFDAKMGDVYVIKTEKG